MKGRYSRTGNIGSKACLSMHKDMFEEQWIIKQDFSLGNRELWQIKTAEMSQRQIVEY